MKNYEEQEEKTTEQPIQKKVWVKPKMTAMPIKGGLMIRKEIQKGQKLFINTGYDTK